MSEFEYHPEDEINYVNHQQQAASNHHYQQQKYYQSASSHRNNDYSSASSESSLDDGYVLFQSVQISIPILPFLIMVGFVLFVMGLRAIKYFQLSVNWHVITRSFKHQVILLSLFFQIPLLVFYLYSLIQFGKSDASLILIIVLNSTIGGVASFVNEKSLGYFVIMFGCFSSSLLVQEAHVKTILICLCFLVVALKIQKIIFQRSSSLNEKDDHDVLQVAEDNPWSESTHNFRQALNNQNRHKLGIYENENNRVYGGHRFQDNDVNEPHHFTKSFTSQNNRPVPFGQPQPTNKLHPNPADLREVHDEGEDIYVRKASNWNWGSLVSNLKWFSKKQDGDILERKNVKLQVPERKKVLFDKPINNVVNTMSNERNETTKPKSFTPMYPSLSSNTPTSESPEEVPRTGISPYLLNHSLPLTQSNSMKQQHQIEERPRALQTEDQPNRNISQMHIAKRSQQQVPPSAPLVEPQSAFHPRAGVPLPISSTKQRPPIIHSVAVEEEEEFIPAVSTFDQDDDDEE